MTYSLLLVINIPNKMNYECVEYFNHNKHTIKSTSPTIPYVTLYLFFIYMIY